MPYKNKIIGSYVEEGHNWFTAVQRYEETGWLCLSWIQIINLKQITRIF